MSQNNQTNLIGWAAIITAIATLLGTFGLSQIFPEIIKKIFLLEKTSTGNSQSIELSPNAIKKLENYISSQSKNITEENKKVVLENALEKYINSQEPNSTTTTRPTVESQKQPIVTKPKITSLDWNDSATSLDIYNKLDQDYTYICPSGGSIGTIYGTDIYTSGSSICTAAVHSGLINAKDGGEVTIRIQGVQEAYKSTTRNGVKSKDDWNDKESFIFVKEEE